MTRNLGCFTGKTKLSSLPPKFRCVAEKPSLIPIGKGSAMRSKGRSDSRLLQREGSLVTPPSGQRQTPDLERSMVWKWGGDLFGRGCLIWWVVSRPTASLTPHQTGCEYLSDSLACWTARRCFVQIVFYTLYWCSFCFRFESLSTLALGDNSEWFFMILRAPFKSTKRLD